MFPLMVALKRGPFLFTPTSVCKEISPIWSTPNNLPNLKDLVSSFPLNDKAPDMLGAMAMSVDKDPRSPFKFP